MNFDRLNNLRPLVGLSPMAGYTDSAFRTICRKQGADFVVTELVSVDGILQSWKAGQKLSKSYELMRFDNKERPVLVQLFGGDAAKMQEAAKIVAQELKPDGININMGCPAHKIVCQGYGSALLQNPKLAASIVTAAKNGSDLPVSVKTRLGWDDDAQIKQFSAAVADAGADSLMIHGRTFKQGYAGEANWQPIYEIKNQIKIPVLGNGDIRSAGDAIEKVKNLDGILVGRAAVGNPWIFAEIRNALDSLKDPSTAVGMTVSLEAKMEMLRLHAKMELAQKGQRGLIEMRKFLPAYIKGLPNAAALRTQAVHISSLEDIEEFIKKVEGSR